MCTRVCLHLPASTTSAYILPSTSHSAWYQSSCVTGSLVLVSAIGSCFPAAIGQRLHPSIAYHTLNSLPIQLSNYPTLPSHPTARNLVLPGVQCCCMYHQPVVILDVIRTCRNAAPSSRPSFAIACCPAFGPVSPLRLEPPSFATKPLLFSQVDQQEGEGGA